LWWILNILARGVGSVLMSFFGHMRWGYKRISGGFGGCFLVIPDLSWEMAQRLDSGMTCGVKDKALNEYFLDLYSIACIKDASVTVHLELSSGSHQ